MPSQSIPKKRYDSILSDISGAAAVEYAVLVALIAVVIIVAVVLLGNINRGAFDAVSSEIAEQTESSEDKNKCGDKDSSDDHDCGIGND